MQNLNGWYILQHKKNGLNRICVLEMQMKVHLERIEEELKSCTWRVNARRRVRLQAALRECKKDYAQISRYKRILIEMHVKSHRVK